MDADSLKIEYDEDTHELRIDWDKNDPQWAFLNDLTDEDIQTILAQGIQQLTNENS